MQLYFISYFGYVIQKWPANKPAINGAYWVIIGIPQFYWKMFDRTNKYWI